MIHGIDVSAYQPKVDWKRVREAGADFAIVKLTEGTSYKNPHASAQIEGALKEGFLVMGYHFARPNGPNWSEDAHAEAELLKARNTRNLFCFLDVERNEPLDETERIHWREWCDVFRLSMQPQAIGFYSYGPFLQALNLNNTWSNTLLWLARYPMPFKPDCQYGNWPTAVKPWARCDLWQHGGNANKATWPGVDGHCDVNTWAGNRVQLLELIASAR